MQDDGVRRTGPGILALLALRFLLELGLLGAFLAASVILLAAPGGWVVGILVVLAVSVVWGVLLSPKRPVRWPLGVRVAIELVLFAAAAVLLARAGLPLLGGVLLTLELLVLGLLRGPDTHAL